MTYRLIFQIYIYNASYPSDLCWFSIRFRLPAQQHFPAQQNCQVRPRWTSAFLHQDAGSSSWWSWRSMYLERHDGSMYIVYIDQDRSYSGSYGTWKCWHMENCGKMVHGAWHGKVGTSRCSWEHRFSGGRLWLEHACI